MDTRVYRRSHRWVYWFFLAAAPPYCALFVVLPLRSNVSFDALCSALVTSLLMLSAIIRCVHDLATPYACVSEREITFYGGRRPHAVSWDRVRQFSPWGKGDLWYLWLYDAPPVEVRVSGVPVQDRERLRLDILLHVRSAVTA